MADGAKMPRRFDFPQDLFCPSLPLLPMPSSLHCNAIRLFIQGRDLL
jgi:hypothetical protein